MILLLVCRKTIASQNQYWSMKNNNKYFTTSRPVMRRQSAVEPPAGTEPSSTRTLVQSGRKRQRDVVQALVGRNAGGPTSWEINNQCNDSARSSVTSLWSHQLDAQSLSSSPQIRRCYARRSRFWSGSGFNRTHERIISCSNGGGVLFCLVLFWWAYCNFFMMLAECF